jgi:hypothetical protein
MQKKLHCSGVIITELVSGLYQCYASCDTLRTHAFWQFYRYEMDIARFFKRWCSMIPIQVFCFENSRFNCS